MSDERAIKEALDEADRALEAFCRLSACYYNGYNDKVTFTHPIPIGWVRDAMRARDKIRALSTSPQQKEAAQGDKVRR